MATISVETKGNSCVGLMAVDQRVNDLKTSFTNDLTQGRMQDASKSHYFSDVFNQTSYHDLYSYLNDANVVFITDAVKGQPDCTPGRFTVDDNIQSDESYEPMETSEQNQLSMKQMMLNLIPETWLFKNFKVDASGQQTREVKIPDTLTSYVISGFSIHKTEGFALAQPQTISVFKQFFVDILLPPSAIIDEVVKVEVFAFNFLKNQFNIKITLENEDGEYEILNDSGDICKMVTFGSQKTKTVRSLPEVAAKTHFFIKPKKIGLLNIKVTAKANNVAQDQNSKFIKIESKGLKEVKSKSKLFDLRNRKHDSIYFNMPAPSNAIKSSLRLDAVASGDLLGPSLEFKET